MKKIAKIIFLIGIPAALIPYGGLLALMFLWPLALIIWFLGKIFDPQNKLDAFFASQNAPDIILKFVLPPLILFAVFFYAYAYTLAPKRKVGGIPETTIATETEMGSDKTSNSIEKQTPTVTSSNKASQNVLVDNTSCSQSALYGFSYYVAPNTDIVCYKTAQLKTGDIATFIPLETIPAVVLEKIVPAFDATQTYDLAFDKNYFYINGTIYYSEQDRTYEYLNAPGYGKFALITIDGEEYQVVMTGTVGGTLKQI